jgi:hypothetical protein
VEVFEIAQQRDIQNATEIEKPFFYSAFSKRVHFAHKDEIERA